MLNVIIILTLVNSYYIVKWIQYMNMFENVKKK